MNLSQALLDHIAKSIWSRSPMPMTMLHDGQVYNIGYVRSDDDKSITFEAWIEATGKTCATLVLRAPGDQVDAKDEDHNVVADTCDSCGQRHYDNDEECDA